MSRIIGKVFASGKEFNVRQDQHAQPNGEYAIQDKDKRSKYEAELSKENKNNE